MFHNQSLETFIIVSETLSFNKAAEQMFITPSAVLKQIDALEKEYQMKFFNRSHHGLTLTHVGQQFLENAKEVVKASLTAERNMRNYEDDCVINICRSIQTPIYKELLCKAKELYPQMEFNVVPFDTDSSLRVSTDFYSLIGTKFDVAFDNVDESFEHRYSNIACKPLMKNRIRLAMSIQHPLAEKENITIEDLKGYNIIIYASEWYKEMRNLKTFLNQHKDIHYSAVNFPLVDLYNHVANSNDLLTSSEVWIDYHPMVTIRRVEWPFFFDLGVIYQKNPSIKVQLFLKAMEKAIEEYK